MPLTKDQKNQVVEDIKALLDSSKLTVLANYSGVSVKQMQDLRKMSKENETSIKIVKNRLVKIAMGQSDKYKDADTSALSSQLLYAFNADDEVAPAQTLNKFKKAGASVEFVGAFTSEGEFIGAQDVKALANLPSKQQLRARLAGVFKAPMSGFAGVLSGNLRGVLNVLDARAESIK
jgi:large subunit ribosomal protein L10